MPATTNLSRIGGHVRAAIVRGGIVAGTVDVAAAVTIFHVGPLKVLQSIAGGLLGKSAYQGGVPVALLGLLLQWAMGMIIAAIFVLAAGRLPTLIRHWAFRGATYGLMILVGMNYLVVPRSTAGNGSLPHFSAEMLIANLLAMIVYGCIVAWFARRHAPIDKAVIGSLANPIKA